jgi:hypothetical protein
MAIRVKIGPARMDDEQMQIMEQIGRLIAKLHMGAPGDVAMPEEDNGCCKCKCKGMHEEHEEEGDYGE